MASWTPTRGRTEGQQRTGTPSASQRSSSPSSSSTTTTTTTSNATAATSTSASRFERLQSHMLTSLLSLQSVPPPNRLPVVKNKEPLSLPTTTRNFRGFVQKSGPVFLIQDTVHETLMWDHPSRTICVMAAWAVIALHPYLLVPLPPFFLTLLLIQTYQARYPVKADDPASPVKPADVLAHALQDPTSTGHGKPRPPMVPEPPHEGSVKYYENLRDIQNMMKMITDAYDLLAPFAVHLNWSSHQHTLLIFQLLILTTLSLFFIAPYLPYRWILLVAGEGAFLLNHPWTQPLLTQFSSRFLNSNTKQGRKLQDANRRMVAQLNEWIKMDQLPDDVWTRGWRDVEVYENERFVPARGGKSGQGDAKASGWSGHHLRLGERRPWTKGADGYADDTLQSEGYSLDVSRKLAMTLPRGWTWIEGDDWRIDFLGRWSTASSSSTTTDTASSKSNAPPLSSNRIGVDDEGWCYTDGDWHRPAPYAWGHLGAPRRPPIASTRGKASGLFSLGSGGEDGDDDGIGSFADGIDGQSSDEEDDDMSLPLDLVEGYGTDAASPGSGGPPRAETRRRRWLRRAVRVEEDEGTDGAHVAAE